MIEDDIERAIKLMQDETLSTLDYLCQSKNKEIIRKVYETMEGRINDLEKENNELKNIIKTARMEKARLVSELNEVNTQLKMLECTNKKVEQDQKKEIIKYRVDYLQKTKRTEKRRTDDRGTTVKRPKNKAEEVPEIITLDY